MELLEFYPTPDSLLEKILDGIKWNHVRTILEPSAGKGNIVSFIKAKAHTYPHYNDVLDIDCIEKDETLQKILKGSGMRLVHDDFLTYHTGKSYDMIIMNPPFSVGDKHLSKALDIQESTGGDVICILNAETIKNPYSNLRKELLQRLSDAGAIIEYMTQEFASAERTTNVEIAVVKVHYEVPEYSSNIFDGLKKKYYSEDDIQNEETELAVNDFIKAAVKRYELEVEAGLSLIKEYRAIEKRLMPNLKEEDNTYCDPMLKLTSDGNSLSVNSFVEQVRMKYWRALFSDRRITGEMTSNLQKDFSKRVEELRNYEFSLYNIKTIQLEMSKNLVKGIEDCIIDLFDKLSWRHSWYPESEKNIHYFNGWATNKAWIINKKVIIPLDAFGQYSWNKGFDPSYQVRSELADIEKALNYLDGGLTDSIDLDIVLNEAKKSEKTKDIHLKYFNVTFYKEGTCHIVFTNEDLLKKLNIFGSQRKGWLPPSYGKKKYNEMENEEKAVIDEFEGEAAYNKTICNSDYYLFDAPSMMLIEEKTA